MFLFKQPKKIRKRGSMPPDEVKEALDRFLDGEQTQELVRFLVRYWKDQQTVLTFKEIREAILAGAVTAQMMKDWQQDYSKMVAEKFEPEWTAAMEKGALNEMAHKGLDIGFKFRKDHWAVRDWLKDRTAMLVTNSTNEQKEAIRNIIAEGIDKKMTVKELEKFIRPCIGLTKPQAAANLKYYQNIKRQLREKHPRMTDASIEKKASEASMKYADKQLRQRAYTIAHTERAMAYEYGRYQHTKDLIEEGYLPVQQKVWSAAGNESTCERCRYLDGQAVPMDGYFTEANGNQIFLPTLHPRCRCCARYEDVGKIPDRWTEGQNQPRQLNGKGKTYYKGAPSSWKRLNDNEQILDLNPENRRDNCVNCTVAYKLRKEGYAVVAGEANEKLSQYPFSAWTNPEVIEIEPGIEATDYIISMMGIWGNGALAQVAVEFYEGHGHSFICEQRNFASWFLDVQIGTTYNIDEVHKIFENAEKIEVCRIDTLEVSAMGINSCKEE